VTAFIYADNMREITYIQWLVLFTVMFLIGIYMVISVWFVNLLIRSFCHGSPSDNYVFFIEMYFASIMAMMAISSLTHSPSTAIVTSIIIAVIAAYRLFGNYLDRRAKLLHRRLSPQAPRQTSLPLNEVL
jgi:hypothetical protein